MGHALVALGAPVRAGRHLGRDGRVGLVVPAQHGVGGGAQAAFVAQGVDAVLRGLAVLARAGVEADACASQADARTPSARAGRILGLGLAVHEEDEAMAGRGAVAFFHAPGHALFGQQALEEIEVAFAVLHAVGTLAAVAGEQALGHVLGHAFVPAPDSQIRVLREHVVHDVDEAAVLPDAAVQGVGQQRDPGLHRERLAGEAAVGVQGAGFGDDAAAQDVAAIGQLGAQGQGLAAQLLERHVGIEHQDLQRQVEGLGHRLVQLEALQQEVAGAHGHLGLRRLGARRVSARRRGKGVQPAALRPLGQQALRHRANLADLVDLAWQFHRSLNCVFGVGRV